MAEPGFQWTVRVYWEDTDAGGIVFYANYLKFFERARTEWLRSLGIEQQKLRESTGGMFVVSQTSIRYLRPARLDDELLVTANLSEIGRASMLIGQSALLKSEHGESKILPADASGTKALTESAHSPLCEGSIRIGWVNASTLQPMRIPAHIIDSLKR